MAASGKAVSLLSIPFKFPLTDNITTDVYEIRSNDGETFKVRFLVNSKNDHVNFALENMAENKLKVDMFVVKFKIGSLEQTLRILSQSALKIQYQAFAHKYLTDECADLPGCQLALIIELRNITSYRIVGENEPDQDTAAVIALPPVPPRSSTKVCATTQTTVTNLSDEAAGQFSDQVNLIFGSEEVITVHKSFLLTYSTVFYQKIKLGQYDAIETFENLGIGNKIVEDGFCALISDVEYDVMAAIIDGMFGNEMKIPDALFAVKVMNAATKYGIEFALNAAKVYIEHKITDEHCMEILAISTDLEDEFLERVALSYIGQRRDEGMKMRDFANYRKYNRQIAYLLLELFETR